MRYWSVHKKAFWIEEGGRVTDDAYLKFVETFRIKALHFFFISWKNLGDQSRRQRTKRKTWLSRQTCTIVVSRVLQLVQASGIKLWRKNIHRILFRELTRNLSHQFLSLLSHKCHSVTDLLVEHHQASMCEEVKKSCLHTWMLLFKPTPDFLCQNDG